MKANSNQMRGAKKKDRKERETEISSKINKLKIFMLK